MRTLSRAIYRRTRREPLEPSVSWVNDEQFEILESGAIVDEYPQPNTAAQRVSHV